MIVLLLLLASARAVTINSPAKWNIVDGVIPKGLDAEKGCHSGLKLSETKPMASIPISCANIRYSVYDSSVATMENDKVTIDRSYTERNVVSDDGVCKMQMSSMDRTTAADVYTKGQDMKFFSRYGYCDGTYTGTKHFTETTFVSDRSCQEGLEPGYLFPIYTEEECAFYTGKTVSVIGDMTQPFGCWSDGTFNAFNRGEHLDVHLDSEVQVAKAIRKQELLDEWGNLTARLTGYSISETVPDFVPETVTLHSPGSQGLTKLEIYLYHQTVVRARLQNIAEQINSAWGKFKYLRDLNAQLVTIDNKLLNMKADMIAYNEVVEKLKLYGVTKNTKFSLFFGLGNSTRQEMQDKVGSLNFTSEVSALDSLLDVTTIYTNYMNAYNDVKNGGSDDWVDAWCQNSQNHRLYTTIIGKTGIDMQCFPTDSNVLYCPGGSKSGEYEFTGWNISAPCGGGTVNYGFPEYGNDDWYESALVKLGLNTAFIVDGPTSFKYLATRVPMDSENYISDGSYQERYEGIHHMLDFRSIYKALQNITTVWKNLRVMSDYSISYENPDLTLSEVDREKRVEARDLSWGNIRARETAIARGVLRGESNNLDIDPLYESLVKLNHKCENCACYTMSYDPNNDKPDAIRADCKEQCVGHDGFLLYWDTSQPRVDSQRDRHRSSCVCAGDGEPISELECVLSNREWISNIRIDQYELTPTDPTVKTEVQTKDVYLHCPGSMCSNGPTEGCWDDTICKVGEVCTEVSGIVSAVFKSDYGDVMGSTTEIVHPWRLTPTTFLFRVVMTTSKVFHEGESVEFTAYDHYIVGITTDLGGNQLEVKSYTTETIDSAYANGYMTKAYWDGLPIYTISVRNGIYQNTVPCVGDIDGCPTVFVQHGGRIVSEEGMWCTSGWFNNGCQEGCKPGFLEEDCSCGDSACKAGQYCTKDGVCKDVVKKEKKFLQIRYNSLE